MASRGADWWKEPTVESLFKIGKLITQLRRPLWGYYRNHRATIMLWIYFLIICFNSTSKSLCPNDLMKISVLKRWFRLSLRLFLPQSLQSMRGWLEPRGTCGGSPEFLHSLSRRCSWSACPSSRYIVHIADEQNFNLGRGTCDHSFIMNRLTLCLVWNETSCVCDWHFIYDLI